MTNNVSQVLGVIQRDLFGLGKTVDLTSGKFNAMKLAAAGAMTAIAGAAVVTGLGKVVAAGAEVVHQQQLMYAAGMSNRDVAQATAQAWQTTSSVMGTAITDNLKSIRELRMVFGSTAEAIQYLPVMAQAQQVVGSLLGRDSQDQVFDLAKALEIKGVSMDPQHFQGLLDQMIKASVASGGRVTGSQFLSAFKYGRAATQGWNDQFIAQILPTLIQEMSGGGGSGSGGPGNALMSAYAAVVGGTMSNKAAEQFYKLHLLQPGSVIFTSTGNVKGIRPGGVAGSGEFASNPFQWVQDYLVPALTRAHITDPTEIREMVAHMFTNRTAQQIVDMFATQQVRFQKDAALQQQAQGMSAWSTLINGDLTTNWNAFTTSVGNFIKAIGVPLVPLATKALHDLTVDIDALTLWASKHPSDVKIIGEVATGLSLVAVGLGAVAVVVATGSALMLAFSPAGWVVLGLTAVSTAALTLYSNFKTLADFMKGMFPELDLSPAPQASPSGKVKKGPWWNSDANTTFIPDAYVVPRRNPGNQGAPTLVYLVNPGDVGHAVKNGLGRSLSAPQSGPSGFNGRATPYGTPAVSTVI